MDLFSVSLAAAYGDDDFDAVTLGQGSLGMTAPWHDFAVAFHRDALADETACLDQGGYGQCLRKDLGFAVDDDFHE